MRGISKFIVLICAAQKAAASSTVDEAEATLERARMEAMVSNEQKEIEANAAIVDHMNGLPILYGQVIQLLHVKSSKYFTMVNKSLAELEKSCTMVALRSHAGPACYFQVNILSGTPRAAARNPTVKAAAAVDTCCGCAASQIMPRFKLRSEGEKVVVGDHCLLVSPKSGECRAAAAALAAPVLHLPSVREFGAASF